jgi:hypothetical protein
MKSLLDNDSGNAVFTAHAPCGQRSEHRYVKKGDGHSDNWALKG